MDIYMDDFTTWSCRGPNWPPFLWWPGLVQSSSHKVSFPCRSQIFLDHRKWTVDRPIDRIVASSLSGGFHFPSEATASRYPKNHGLKDRYTSTSDILQIYFKYTSSILQSNASQICFICFTCLFRKLQDMCYITFQRWGQLPDPPTSWLLLHPHRVAFTFKLRMFNGFNGLAEL